MESILSKLTFVLMLWIKIEVICNYIHLIFKIKAIQECQLCELQENSNVGAKFDTKNIWNSWLT